MLRVMVLNQIDRTLLLIFAQSCEVLRRFLLSRDKFKQTCFLLLEPEFVALVHHLLSELFILNLIVFATELERVFDVTP